MPERPCERCGQTFWARTSAVYCPACRVRPRSGILGAYEIRPQANRKNLGIYLAGVAQPLAVFTGRSITHNLLAEALHRAFERARTLHASRFGDALTITDDVVDP